MVLVHSENSPINAVVSPTDLCRVTPPDHDPLNHSNSPYPNCAARDREQGRDPDCTPLLHFTLLALIGLKIVQDFHLEPVRESGRSQAVHPGWFGAHSLQFARFRLIR